MSVAIARRLSSFGLAGVCVLLFASSASAATNPFGCRASLARVSLGATTAVEPLVANKSTTPCATDSDGVNSVSVPSVGAPLVKAGPASVYTFSSDSEPTTTGPVLPGATALTAVDGVTIPDGSGSIVIVGPVQDQVSYACTDAGKLTTAASSSLDLIYVNGQAIQLTAPGANQTLSLGALGSISTNVLTQTATSLTEQLLVVHLLGTAATIVVGEAQVTQGANPCAGTGPYPPPATTTPTPPSLGACPVGSTLDVAAQECVIVLPNGTVIVVSRPFEGPTGGTVLALSVARKEYKSPCLYGSGPQYVIVGTNGPDRINGTHRSERILGLGGNDRIAGQGGNDCIDGGAGNDKIYGGNGNERIYGATGNDRISVQNGNSLVYGGTGNDTIFLGNGNSHVYGGAGNDRISVGRGSSHVYGNAGNDTIAAGDGNNYLYGGAGNDTLYAGNGNDHVYGGSGNDRIYGRAIDLDVFCGTGQDLAYVPTFDAPFAKSHGCERVRGIKIKRS
jgi:Ca2+-binding RTX toxin-like protein